MENGAPDIAFHGYLFSPTGYGTAARAYIHAFHKATIGMSVFDLDTSQRRFVPDPLVASCLNLRTDPVLHVWHCEPEFVRSFKGGFPPFVALTTWEADTLPPIYVDALNKALEVWVPSRFNLDAFRQQLTTPVFQIPHPVHTPHPACFRRTEVERQLGLKEDSYVFLSMGTWQERKNLPDVIEAFLRAFPDEPNAVLIVKTSFCFTNERLVHGQISEAIKRASPVNVREAVARIKICPEFWPEECMTALMQRADCLVSLHRGEGWCYPLFDAACSGTPVIATAYSGPMDYLDPQYHRLVRYELTPANQQKHAARFAFNSDMSWAAPDVTHAAELMRDVYDRREHAMKQAAQGSVLLQEKYSLDAIGRMAGRRLTELAENVCPAGCSK